MVVFEGRAFCGAKLSHSFARSGRTQPLARDAGVTLVELLVAMSILLVVLGAIMTPLVSATKAEADLQSRFRAEESARLALTTFQRDVHCATAVSPTSGSVATITLTLSTGCESGSTSVTWCAVASGSTYDLWRIPAGTCSTSTAGGRRMTQILTNQSIFTPDATVHLSSPVTLSVRLALDVKTGTSTYQLTTSVYSRTGARQ